MKYFDPIRIEPDNFSSGNLVLSAKQNAKTLQVKKISNGEKLAEKETIMPLMDVGIFF